MAKIELVRTAIDESTIDMFLVLFNDDMAGLDAPEPIGAVVARVCTNNIASIEDGNSDSER